jgi:hypothetical protein
MTGSPVLDLVHRLRFAVIAIYSVAFLAVVSAIAANRYFWYDEGFTMYIAALPSYGGIWTALGQGAENLPPLSFWLVHSALGLPMAAELAARLPAILCYWLMTLCLYRIVARETHALYGLVAMLAPLAAPTVYFAYEARPYAPLLLTTAASVLFWQMARAGTHRPWSVVLFGVMLAASVYLHYYAIFVFFPFAVAELVRGIRSGGWDRAVWLAILLAGAATLPLVPLVLASSSFTVIFNDPSLSSLAQLYGRLLGLPSVVFVVLTIASWTAGYREPVEARSAGSSVLNSRDGAVLLLGFCAVPILGFVVARSVTSAWADRYLLFTVVGFSIGFALLVFHQCRTRPWLAAAGLAGLAAIGATEVRQHYIAPSYRAGASADVAEAVRAARAMPRGEEPLVLPGMLFLGVSYHAPADVRARLRFLDEDPSDIFSVAARRLAVVDPLPLVGFAELKQRHERFYLYKPSPAAMRQMQRLALNVDYAQHDWYLVSAAPRQP